MLPEKQSATFNFGQGIETLSDQNQLPIGRFTVLQNSVFIKSGNEGYASLQKRNGYGQITTITGSVSTFLTTYNNNVVAVGPDVKAYSPSLANWISKGQYDNVQLNVEPLIRNASNQVWSDIAINSNGLGIVSYAQTSSGGSFVYNWACFEPSTGSLVSPITAVGSNTIAVPGANKFPPKVFSVGPNFILVFDGGVTGTTVATGSIFFQPVSASNPNIIGSASSFASYTGYLGYPGSYDGVVASNTLYLLWNETSGFGLNATTINSALSVGATSGIAVPQSYSISAAFDSTGSGTLWATCFTVCSGSVNATGSSLAYGLTTSLTPKFSKPTDFTGQAGTVNSQTQFATLSTIVNNGDLLIFYNAPSTFLAGVAYPTSTAYSQEIYAVGVSGVSGSSSQRAVLYNPGMAPASRPFIVNGSVYFMAAYGGYGGATYQPTYFIVNPGFSGFMPRMDLAVLHPRSIAKIAYGNGGGYPTLGLTSAPTIGSTAYLSYQFKDLVTSVNKSTIIGSTTQSAAVYSQTGINLANINFSPSIQAIGAGGDLLLNGGQVQSFDGVTINENNFHLFPESISVTTGTSSGALLTPQTYFYTACYAWTDYAGNVIRSAPSVPQSVVVASGSNVNYVFVPNIPVTGKINTSVELYRWSQSQQSYYQVTSGSQPFLVNNFGTGTFNSIVIPDSNSDAQILGNNLLYTTGGVVENSGPPAPAAMTLFDSRMWLIDAEDPNLLWFSKPIAEATPVEFSDLFTIFVPPTTSAQASTGPMKCIAPMDDKLIIFKAATIYYINGTGPDLTGANSQYSQPIFVSAGVGCTNQNSIVLTPGGLIFQSDKGIWLLKRDLTLEYVGKDVDEYNSANVKSALLIPGTNQVRFTMDNGLTLMFDYLANQWGTFNGIPGVSSTIYNGLHTYLDSSNNVFQETPGTYLDGSTATVMKFQTGFVSLAGLQGYQRAYRFYLLGNYKTPHTMTLSAAYDYDSTPLQTATINPDNNSSGSSLREQWQFNFQRQQCQSFQLTFQETASSTAGAGLTLSGINLVYGGKKPYSKNIPPTHRIG